MTATTPNALKQLNFDNRFVDQLPADPETQLRARQVHKACYSWATPKKTSNPKLIAYASEVAELLDLDEDSIQSELFTQTFVGNTQIDGMQPYACCYGGHQFGHWAGQLGDGRAINLGEIINQQGQRWALQLKGSGPTPYSRNADGFAVLRSSVREFLCSEAMHHLGVPTTRALSLILTGDEVMRDMLYDGHPAYEEGAVVCRIAPSFTRFGSFQIHTARNDLDTLKQLVDYTLETDFPHLGKPSHDTYHQWFAEVCQRTADLMVHWMRVGFVHGVMNTDNLSILGLTIDYGPYGWLEDFNPGWTPNTTDAANKRYRYNNQPQIAHWNLVQLAQAIVPLTEDPEPFQQALSDYVTRYETSWQTMMESKLGLVSTTEASDEQKQNDEALVAELIQTLQLTETDMTLFFRYLANLELDKPVEDISTVIDAYYTPDDISEANQQSIIDWLESYRLRVLQLPKADINTRKARMNAVNPKYVLRNYLAQMAIDKADDGDYSLINTLLEVLRKPYDEQPEHEEFAKKRPEWARHKAGCSMLSCSS